MPEREDHPASPAATARQARQAALAKALRDNLRRRKAAVAPSLPVKERPQDS